MKKVVNSLKVFFAFALAPLVATAGTGGSNGDYCTQVGSDCQRVEFRISNEHPMQQSLLSKIKSAKLPKNLKNQMLKDLSDTQVIYSGERIQFQELIKRYELQIIHIEEETVRDAAGDIIETIERKTWSRREIGPLYGIYINASDVEFKTEGELKDVWVRAVSETNFGRVIYFNKFVDDMSAYDKEKLVLHEQAHRLNILSHFHEDPSHERLAEGWAAEMLNYLNGKVSEQSFYQTLRAFNVPTIDRYSFPNKKRLSSKEYYSDITVVVEPAELLNYAVDAGYKYFVGLDRGVFEDYSGLIDADQIIETRGVFGENDRGGLKLVDRMEAKLAPLINGTGPITLDLRVRVQTLTNTDGNLLTVSEHVDSIVFSPKKLMELQREWLGIINSHAPEMKGLGSDIGGLSDFVINPNAGQAKVVALKTATALSRQLDGYSQSRPLLYPKVIEILNSSTLSLMVDDTMRIVHSYKVLNVDVKEDATDVEIRLAVAKFVNDLGESLKPEAQAQYLESMGYPNGTLFVSATGDEAKQLEIIGENSKLKTYAQCIGVESKTYRGASANIKINVVDSGDILDWKWSVFREHWNTPDKKILLELFVPQNVLGIPGGLEAVFDFVRAGASSDSKHLKISRLNGSNEFYLWHNHQARISYKRNGAIENFNIIKTKHPHTLMKFDRKYDLKRLRHDIESLNSGC